MDRWEYRLFTGTVKMAGVATPEFLGDLNSLGQEGWEAVAYQHDVRTAQVLLKRRVPSS